jgi:hypothetical protein
MGKIVRGVVFKTGVVHRGCGHGEAWPDRWCEACRREELEDRALKLALLGERELWEEYPRLIRLRCGYWIREDLEDRC